MIQGGVLSPTLFLIMFNDLIQELDEEGYEVFAYADDLAVIDWKRNRALRAIEIIEN